MSQSFPPEALFIESKSLADPAYHSNDSSFLYDDGSCSTSGATIPTPSGDGTWSTTNCGAATDQVLGTISAGGNTYTCYRANDQNFSNFCGETYACSVYASCYGP